MILLYVTVIFFFHNTAPTTIYTLSLHDALPILFARPGLGTLMVDSVFDRDYAVLQSLVLLAAATFILSSLAIDLDRKSTRLNSSHPSISYAVFCLKKKTTRSISAFLLTYLVT